MLNNFDKRSKLFIWALVAALLNLMLVSAVGATISEASSASADGVNSAIVSSCYSDINQTMHATQHNNQDCQNSQDNNPCSTCVQLQATITAGIFETAVIPNRLQSVQSEELVTFFSPPIPRPPTTYPL